MYRRILLCLLMSLYAWPTWSGQDPMRPVRVDSAPMQAEARVDTSHWRLNLIRQTGPERIALLNGKLLKVGGRIDGAKVVAIEEHRVILRLPDEQSIELNLPSVELRNMQD